MSSSPAPADVIAVLAVCGGSRREGQRRSGGETRSHAQVGDEVGGTSQLPEVAFSRDARAQGRRGLDGRRRAADVRRKHV